MSVRTLVTIASIVAVLVCLGGYAVSQDEPAAGQGPQQPSPEQMREMMQKWLATIEPGQEHELLKKMVGDWTTTIRMWMAGPQAPPSETKGTVSIQSILGGRYTLQTFHGKVPMPQASGEVVMQDFEGLGVTGFDRYRNVYKGGWIDDMSTQMLTMTGTYNPTTKSLVMYGQADEPMLDMIGRTVKYKTKFIDDDEFVFAIYDLAAGDDYKVMEITYERAK